MAVLLESASLVAATVVTLGFTLVEFAPVKFAAVIVASPFGPIVVIAPVPVVAFVSVDVVPVRAAGGPVGSGRLAAFVPSLLSLSG